MRGHVKRRCPAPEPGQPKCTGKSCSHPYAYWLDLPRGADGKRRQQSRSGFGTKREAQTALSEALAKTNAGTFTEPSAITVAGYLATWLAGLDRKPATLEAYRRVVERQLTPQLGTVRLQHLTAPKVKAAYRALQDGGLSPTTVQLVHQVLSKALSDAVKHQLVGQNVAALVEAPRRSRLEFHTWTAEQVGAFLRHVVDDRLAAMWRLFLTTGMRRGEVAALRWQDVDLERATLAVRQTGNRLKGGVWTVGTPKGRGDAAAKSRKLSLDAGTVAALRAHRTRQLEERLAWGSDWQDVGLVFVREDGSPLNPTTIGHRLTTRAKQGGLPHLRVHDLRHTYATLALETGVHPKVVSERLGHANIGITLNLYSHVTEGMDRDAADRVAGLFS